MKDPFPRCLSTVVALGFQVGAEKRCHVQGTIETMVIPAISRTSDKQPFSWSSHALLTRAGLRSFDHSGLKESVNVVDLVEFLDEARSDLPELVRWYWRLLDRKAGSLTQNEDTPPDVRSVADFLSVMQLNPAINFEYARLLDPEEVDPDAPHDPSRDGPPGGLYIPTCLGTSISAFQILFTYSDEPDWGMDQDLFELPNHRYGPPPFGMTNGISSQGPFHMVFLHENPLLLKLLPDLGRSFLPERIRACFALAELAFAKRVNYWGWRFTAWAIHYLQDLTAPYHACAFPPSPFRTLVHLVLHPDQRSYAKRIGDILKNHHVLFESLLHVLLNEAVKKQPDHPFLLALASARGTYDVPLTDVLHTFSRVAAGIARRLDKMLMELIDDRSLEDEPFTGEKCVKQYLFNKMANAEKEKPDLLLRFTDLVSECLTHTGNATRFAVLRSVAPDHD